MTKKDPYLQDPLTLSGKNTYPDLKKNLKTRHFTESKVNPPAPETLDELEDLRQEPESYIVAENVRGEVPCIEEVCATTTKRWRMPSENRYQEKPLMGNTALPMPPASPEDNYLLRDEVSFERVAERIFVNVIAISKNPSDNSARSILAEGDPLGGYAYTPESDQFVVSCQDWFPLGLIPMAFRLVVKGYLGKMVIPLPEGLIVRSASPNQKKALKAFKEKYPDCSFEFVQSLYRA